jgi:uroporphyrinogen-III synthase
LRNRDKPLRIIVTRPEPDARAFADEACVAGFEPIVSPVMTIVFGAAPPALDGVGALAFTSANGARAYAASGAAVGLPVIAVGGLTAKEAERLGFSDLTVAGGDIESLAAAIVGAKGRFTGRVLHVAGTDRAGDLAGALRAAGVEAETAILYRAEAAARLADEAAAALAADPPAEAVALFSPRSARLFVDLARKAGLEERLEGVAAACLSEAVAKAAAETSWRRIIIAEARSGGSLLSTLLREIDRGRG